MPVILNVMFFQIAIICKTIITNGTFIRPFYLETEKRPKILIKWRILFDEGWKFIPKLSIWSLAGLWWPQRPLIPRTVKIKIGDHKTPF